MRIRVVTLGVALVLAGSGCVKTSRDVAVPSAPDDRGLVAHWTFDEGRGSVAKDVTGNGHDARLKGAQTLPEGHGRALLLEAKEAYADAGVAPGFQTAAGGAFSLWFRPRKLQGGLVNWSKGSGWTDIRLTLAFNTFYGGNEFLVSVSDGRSFEKIPVPAPPLDQWTHMAVSFAGPNLTVFVNGVPAVSRSVNCVPDRTGIPLWIGRCEGLGEA
ncbi:MAG: LamG domain-containing protein, partial [Planctomycetes bacterium]|nr:LamG domain-containing protein [Planctomycetota bacterium]